MEVPAITWSVTHETAPLPVPHVVRDAQGRAPSQLLTWSVTHKATPLLAPQHGGAVNRELERVCDTIVYIY